MLRQRRYITVVSLSLLLVSGMVDAAANYYRYANEKGVVVINDRIPAEFVKQGYTIIDDHGNVIKVIAPMRTHEEQKREEELKARRETQERLSLEQAANDRVLLQTFTNANDILRTRDHKLTAIDSTVKVIEGTISRLNDQLHNSIAEAAKKERSGQNVPEALHAEIEDLHDQIEHNKIFIDEKQQEKLAIEIKATVDLRRYQELMGDHSAEAINAEAQIIHKPHELYRCPDLTICNRAWTLAQIFVQNNATTDIQLLTNSLISTGQPVKEDDISLAVSKKQLISGAAELTIEAHCHLSDVGAELCSSSKVQAIITDFYKNLSNRLGVSSKLELQEHAAE